MALEDRIRLPMLNLIHRRPRLLEQLTQFIESQKRLITIYAPGGYGKSILLADFAQTTDLPICWCSLEGADQDPVSFLTVLAYSIADRFWGIDIGRLFELLRRGDTRESVSYIADVLSTVGPHIIILDDYHKAVSTATTLTLNRLLQRLPETNYVIVAARGDMHLETGQVLDLLIADRAAGLSEEDLRFTAPELQRVMLKRFGRRVDIDTAEEIARVTSGNIAQILLTGHMLYAGQGIDRLSKLGDDREFIYSYLATEVLEKQPEDMQRFLLWTSVFPDMTVEMCNELLDITHAQTYIETLIRKGLFISQTGTGFTYHDLFTDFLKSKLAEDEQTYQQVMARASQILIDHSRIEDAINLYIKIAAWDKIIPLLEDKGAVFYSTGRGLTLYNWLSQIPASILTPRLLLLQGRILINDLGESREALNCFQEAEEQFRNAGDLIGAAEAQVWRSMSLWRMGQLNESLKLASQGLTQLETLKAPHNVIAWAIRMRGQAYWVRGEITEALQDFRQALGLFEKLDDPFSMAACHQDIGVCLEKRGNISGAEHHYQNALRYWEMLGNANELANTLNSLGVCSYLRGNYTQALKQFNESFNMALKSDSIRRAAFVQAGMGDTYLAMKAFDQAIEAFTTSTQLARQAGVRSLELYNQVKLGECFFQQNMLSQALTLARRVRDIAQETGLKFEQGLADVLQGKIHVQQGQYETSYGLFSEALECFGDNSILEQAKARFWWGYSLLRGYRSRSALEQLRKALQLSLSMGELIHSLGATIADTRPLLLHFLHKTDINAQVREGIQTVLGHHQRQVEIITLCLQVFAFGAPMLIVAGTRKQFTHRGKARKIPEFLLYLILEGRGGGCRWNEVSVTLWPDLDESKSSASFHQTLKRLRDTLFESSDYVSIQNDYYQVTPEYLTWCDVLAFEALHEQSAKVPAEEAIDLYLEMISLYRGEFLAGFELGEWGDLHRYRYEVTFLQVVTLAARYLLEQNEPREALSIVNRGLEQDLFQEDLHHLAFEAYAQLGLYGLLKNHYTEMCRLFEEELGTTPPPSTHRLYKKLITRR